MKFLRYLFLIPILAAASCSTLPYKDDVGFLVSAQANSPEFPVYVNGSLCSDMKGHTGLCANVIRSNEDVTFKFDAQSYPYLLTVNCSSGIPRVDPSTVPKGRPYTFSIRAQDFAVFQSFTCIGEISPQDRDAPLSAKFQVHITVADAAYVSREKIFMMDDDGKKILVLGQFARTSWVFDDGKWTRYSKKTIVKIKGDPAKVKAYSESFAMRFNFFNMVENEQPKEN